MSDRDIIREHEWDRVGEEALDRPEIRNERMSDRRFPGDIYVDSRWRNGTISWQLLAKWRDLPTTPMLHCQYEGSTVEHRVRRRVHIQRRQRPRNSRHWHRLSCFDITSTPWSQRRTKTGNDYATVKLFDSKLKVNTYTVNDVSYVKRRTKTESELSEFSEAYVLRLIVESCGTERKWLK